MTHNDPRVTVTVKRADEVWYRAFCIHCHKYCLGIERLDRIGGPDNCLVPTCQCMPKNKREFQLVEVVQGEA